MTTTTTTRKEIASWLDRAADYGSLASRKQVWYLAGLLADAGLSADTIECGPSNLRAKLTRAKASRYIDALVKARDAGTDALAALANA